MTLSIDTPLIIDTRLPVWTLPIHVDTHHRAYMCVDTCWTAQTGPCPATVYWGHFFIWPLFRLEGKHETKENWSLCAPRMLLTAHSSIRHGGLEDFPSSPKPQAPAASWSWERCLHARLQISGRPLLLLPTAPRKYPAESLCPPGHSQSVRGQSCGECKELA